MSTKRKRGAKQPGVAKKRKQDKVFDLDIPAPASSATFHGSFLANVPRDIEDLIFDSIDSCKDRLSFVETALKAGHTRFLVKLIQRDTLKLYTMMMQPYGGFPTLAAYFNQNPGAERRFTMTNQRYAGIDKPSDSSRAELQLAGIAAPQHRTYAHLFQSIGTAPYKMNSVLVKHNNQRLHNILLECRRKDEQDHVRAWAFGHCPPLDFMGSFIKTNEIQMLSDTCRHCLNTFPIYSTKHPFLYCHEHLQQFKGKELIQLTDMNALFCTRLRNDHAAVTPIHDYPWLFLYGGHPSLPSLHRGKRISWDAYISREACEILLRMCFDVSLPSGPLDTQALLRLEPSSAQKTCLLTRYNTCMAAVKAAYSMIESEVHKQAVRSGRWIMPGVLWRQLVARNMISIRGMSQQAWYKAAFGAAAASYDKIHSNEKLRAAWKKSEWVRQQRDELFALIRK